MAHIKNEMNYTKNNFKLINAKAGAEIISTDRLIEHLSRTANTFFKIRH